jgi:glycosyltransferase involved in cell wall biosynthesis
MPPSSPTSRVLVVVPALDEEACIGRVVDDIRGAGFDCLVVDDGSTDATAAIAGARGAEVIGLGQHRGIGAALRAGFGHAIDSRYDIVVRIDADGQHPIDACAVLLHSMATGGADMVVGSRFAAPTSYRVPAVRRAAIAALARSIRQRTGHVVTDPTSGLRAIRRPLLDALATHLPDHYLGDTYEVTLQSLRAGYSVVEEPVVMRSRQGGRSSVTWRSMVRTCALLLGRQEFELPRAPAPAAGRTSIEPAQTPTRVPADSPTRATTR